MYKRFIKPVFIGIIGLSVLVTLISLLLPSEVHGRRGIVINADKKMIMEQILDCSNWKHWQPNFMTDSLLVVTDAYGDAVIDHNGKKDFYKKKPGSVSDSSATFIQSREGENDVVHIFTLTKDAATNGTYADWKFITHLKWYPWEKFSGFFTESFTAPGMEQGLENLKKKAEGH